VQIIASADIALKPQTRGATKDLSLVILVVPFCPPGTGREIGSQDVRIGLLSIIEYKPS
jgi:hypothetical protein